MGKPRQRGLPSSSAQEYERAERASSGIKQYLVPYLMCSHPGSTLERGRGAGGVSCAISGYMPEQVQDFYPTPSHALHRHVLHRASIPRTMEPVYVPTDPAREGHAARAHPVPRPEELCPYPRGPCQGRAHGPDRLWPEVPHPAAPRRGRKGAHPAQKQPAQKRPAQKRERPAEKKPAAKPRKAQPAAKEPRRAERGEAFGKPTAAQLRQAERYLKTRKKKQTVKKPTKPKAQGEETCERKPSGCPFAFDRQPRRDFLTS